ncbi:MAG: nitroreductase family protein [Pseudomonadales bacterium]
METYDVMTTTFAARSFTSKPVSRDTLHRILDHARFAPSGGNRQGWRVISIENSDLREQLQNLMTPTIKAYKAMAMAGETPFNSLEASLVDQATIDATSSEMPFAGNLAQAPVVLVVTVDLKKVTAFDQDLDRVGVIPGASIYPFVWNILGAF